MNNSDPGKSRRVKTCYNPCTLFMTCVHSPAYNIPCFGYQKIDACLLLLLLTIEVTTTKNLWNPASNREAVHDFGTSEISTLSLDVGQSLLGTLHFSLLHRTPAKCTLFVSVKVISLSEQSSYMPVWLLQQKCTVPVDDVDVDLYANVCRSSVRMELIRRCAVLVSDPHCTRTK